MTMAMSLQGLHVLFKMREVNETVYATSTVAGLQGAMYTVPLGTMLAPLSCLTLCKHNITGSSFPIHSFPERYWKG